MLPLRCRTLLSCSSTRKCVKTSCSCTRTTRRLIMGSPTSRGCWTALQRRARCAEHILSIVCRPGNLQHCLACAGLHPNYSLPDALMWPCPQRQRFSQPPLTNAVPAELDLRRPSSCSGAANPGARKPALRWPSFCDTDKVCCPAAGVAVAAHRADQPGAARHHLGARSRWPARHAPGA